MDKLPWKEVQEIRDHYDYLDPGQKVRVNHESRDCIGDSNSLIVEKKDDGSISAYCFRCGRSGYYGCKSALKSKQAREKAAANGNGDRGDNAFSYPGGTTEVSDWHPAARAWIGRARITEQEVEKYGIVYNDSIERVIIPWRDSDNTVVSYQTRRIHESDAKPKYLTYWRERLPVVLGADRGAGRSMVFVEDFLSGIRVARFSPVMVLQGVKLQQFHVPYIVKLGYNNFLVWLDDDNVQVKRAQFTLKRNLDKVGKCLIYHGNGVDPKECSDDEIKRILQEWKDGTL